ncbi:hypothetical protein P170DRAFT_509585 [Aspergillus steynii IBT 23096]|uniref:Uncharacterized protein n=1 Tax=Aspergillus steynii IBT 23096 TaxID=1392250 RepID=A0A2I2G7R4_9EURO|nr:uncharacterized protein P170DRAFT_509585 [Aspergillus steynii IBT 23096]PLB48919.1 hypothetical protein P170DRAFT_509585 [Aspergillus steynii IBT 23096]
MSKRIYYTYKTIEAWETHDEEVRKIITEDTKTDNWICNRALPPTCYPPPLSAEAIEKIKKLSDDIVVGEIED